MRPLSTARPETSRYRRALKSRNPTAILAGALVLLGAILLAGGFWYLRDAERAFVGLTLGLVALIPGFMLTVRIRHGSGRSADQLRYLTQGLFWFTLAAGLVILVNGRVPFLGDILEKTPGQNVATDLGNALLGGLIVAAVLIVIELSQRRRDEYQAGERQRESERSTMLLLLGLERDLSRVDLSARDLSWFSLRRRDISRARLRRTCLFRANLEYCDLSHTEFDDADLTNVFLADATLTNAKLQRVVLDYAHLQRARLDGAVLYGATLRGAQLNEVDLRAADLRAADLRGADLGQAVLTGARYDRDTLLDPGIDPDVLGMICDNSEPRSDLLTPTGTSCCGGNHDAERAAWRQQQREAAGAFRANLDSRLADPWSTLWKTGCE